MQKPKIFIPLVLLAIALFFTARASCANKDLVPFFGKWSGAYEVDQVLKGADGPKDRERSKLEGFVQIYGSNRSYKMFLNGEQESLEIGGTWTTKGNRITLRMNDFKLDDQGGEDARNPNAKFIPADELREAYAKPLVLELSADKKRLTGLRTTVGPTVGTHRFAKESF